MSLALRAMERAGPSEKKTLQFLRENSLRMELSEDQRRDWIGRTASLLGGLESDERQRIFLDPVLRQSVAQMTEVEKASFLEKTMAKGIPEAIQGFGTAPPERQLRWLNQALDELEQTGATMRSPLDDAGIQRIAEKGLTAYWAEVDLTTRIELQPFLERLQGILQIPR